ncbi:MAG: transcriptional regulator [Deltaproteobacteria bacterium]|nr:transcriptional regulator [Deltaproteobacteria bacterium]
MQRRDGETFRKAIAIFKLHGGILKTTDAMRAGIHPRVLYAMRDAGLLEQLSRGLHRLTDMPSLGNPGLVSIALKVPSSVICLISALAFHELTIQVPHEVYLAMARGSRTPQLGCPPIRVFWFSSSVFTEGVEQHDMDGVWVRIYSPEKTLADCFKYRNRIGLDTALEALKLYRQRKTIKAEELIRFARVCRVERVMRPYLEAVL